METLYPLVPVIIGACVPLSIIIMTYWVMQKLIGGVANSTKKTYKKLRA